MPVVLKLENTDPHMTDIFEAFVETDLRNSEKVNPEAVEIFEIDDDKLPADVEKFHEVCVDKVLKIVESPRLVTRPTELRPIRRVEISRPIVVDTFEICVDV